MIKVALPKGRIAEQALEIFKDKMGKELVFMDRKLILEATSQSGEEFRFMQVRNADVPAYVERGVADIGVVGLDVLEEQGSDLVRLLDLRFGRCVVALGSPVGYTPDFSKPNLKIATKLENITKKIFSARAVSVDIIKLYGSIELAPLVGLADAIVDLVETGSTMRQNNLKIDEVLMSISSYLVANKNSYYAKKSEILGISDFFKSKISN